MDASWALLATLALAGVWLWRRLAPGLQPLPAEPGPRHGVLLALAAYAGLLVLSAPFVPDGDEPRDFVRLVALQALVGLAVAALVLLAVRGRGGPAVLGLRRAGGPPAPLVALAAWLAFLPVLAAATWLNERLLFALGVEAPAQQRWLEEFLAAPEASRSPVAWAGMVLVLPFFEELCFRGALFGGLRRMLPRPAAVALAAAAFGLVHEPAYWLPTATLGVALVLLYERSGSLAAPLSFHALHNGLTLAIVTWHPELAGGAPA
jgi:hypothetical protein